MKKEAVIRHPHYPEIIKFKVGSLKTISTLSTSNCDNEENCERLSLPGEGCHYQDLCSSECGCPQNKKRSNLNCQGAFEHSYFDIEEPSPPYDDEAMLPDINHKDLGEIEQMQAIFKSSGHYQV